MYIVKADNVGEAFRQALILVREEGFEESTRNGKAKVLPRPLFTCYDDPKQHVLMDPERDANPFFHLYEAMWMLTGGNQIHQLKEFNKNILTFSDDGYTLRGAYGERWKFHFGFDQLETLLTLLDQDPTTRRAVLGMWDPRDDMRSQGSKDLPCNTHIYFRVRNNCLDMTSCCRSNDLVWGCYGANAVHMPVLQEYVAGKLKMRIGVYYQMSNNAHVYERHYELMDHQKPNIIRPLHSSYPMCSGDPGWDKDCHKFVMNPYLSSNSYDTPWFQWVMSNLGLAHKAYKHKSWGAALDFARQIEAKNWREACIAWITRRIK